MSRKYKFHNPSAAYFVPFATVKWNTVLFKDYEREARASVGVLGLSGLFNSINLNLRIDINIEHETQTNYDFKF